MMPLEVLIFKLQYTGTIFFIYSFLLFLSFFQTSVRLLQIFHVSNSSLFWACYFLVFDLGNASSKILIFFWVKFISSVKKPG